MQFKIEVLSTERLELTIEAANFEEAHDIASATCGSEFSVISGSEGWDILEVTEIEPKKEKIKLDGFGEIIEFAESLGWIDTHGDDAQGTWSPSQADSCEEDATDFIESKGYEISN